MTKTQEVLDELDWKTGLPTGRQVLRGDAHRQGIAHRAMHLWVYTRLEGRLVLLFQQRSFEKPNFPGQFGPTVGGHVTSGEGIEALTREAQEEIGLVVLPAQMERLGYNPFHFSLPGGYEDYEWIEDWRCFANQPLADYRFCDNEVIGMLAIEPHRLELARREPQEALYFAGAERSPVQVSYLDFVTGLFESPLFAALVNPPPFLKQSVG
ncbi:MAG: NUDIX domain-containing protein [bacterium]|nr:NUDIX domain-containing protein [bacterium]